MTNLPINTNGPALVCVGGPDPHKVASWSFINATTVTTPMMLLTPVADPTYTDTFAVMTRGISTDSFSVVVGRAGSNQWGQNPECNFLELDLAAAVPFAPGFQTGTTSVGTSTQASQLVRLTWTTPLGARPRLLVTARGAVDNDGLVVASTVTVTSTGATVNVSAVDAQSWDDQVVLDWMAWDDSVIPTLPPNVQQGLQTIVIPSTGGGATVTFTYSGGASVWGTPVVLLGIAASGITGPLAVTVVYADQTTLTVNLACINCMLHQDHPLNVSFLTFPRRTFSSPVTAGALASFQLVTGPLVQEARQVFRNSYAAQIVRLYSSGDDAATVELVNDIGPLDKGRELVTRFSTDLDTAVNTSAGLFVTDDNGLELQVGVLVLTSRVSGSPLIFCSLLSNTMLLGLFRSVFLCPPCPLHSVVVRCFAIFGLRSSLGPGLNADSMLFPLLTDANVQHAQGRAHLGQLLPHDAACVHAEH